MWGITRACLASDVLTGGVAHSVSRVLATTSASDWVAYVLLWLLFGGSVLGLIVWFVVMTPDQRRAQKEKTEASREAMRKSLAEKGASFGGSSPSKPVEPAFSGYHGYKGSPTRKDVQKPVVVKTLPRMTAPYVRRRLIEDMAANGYAMTNMVRTTTGKTVLTFQKTEAPITAEHQPGGSSSRPDIADQLKRLVELRLS